MKDLFVELCLTVPVRLSSLLPYLHMLMDPLVSALNGSQTLINQGLRTLELCVDNLQPDFLYDHIQVGWCVGPQMYVCMSSSSPSPSLPPSLPLPLPPSLPSFPPSLPPYHPVACAR